MIALVSNSGNFSNLPESVIHCASIEEVLAIETPLAGVVLDTFGTSIFETVRQLRGHNRHYTTEVFVVSKTVRPPKEASITSEFTSWDAVVAACEKSEELRTNLPVYSSEELDYEIKLLHYLFVHPNFAITPVLDLRKKRYYSYPLLSSFVQYEADEEQWLQSLVARSFLLKGALLDRIRLCPKCESQQIHFIDSCPSCRSIDIAKEELFHCFTCGTVNTRTTFQHQGALQCPQCQTHLRHIGVDYDRTLEQYQCKSCSDIFAEPDVNARCYSCDTRTKTGDLETREISDYHMNNNAYLTILRGEFRQDQGSDSDDSSYIPQWRFTSLTEWFLAIAKKGSAMNFSVIAVHYPSFRSLLEERGRAQMSTIVENYLNELSILLPSTYRFTRLPSNTILFLLPDPTGDDVAVASKIIAEQSQKSVAGIEQRFATYTYSNDGSAEDDYDSVLGTLMAQVLD